MYHWLQAATFSERLEGLRARPGALAHFQAELAEKRLLRWKSIPAFGKDSCFARKLAMLGCSEQEFLQVLGIPPEHLFPENFEPSWLSSLLAAEREYSAAHPPLSQPGLLVPLLPWIGFQGRRLLREIENNPAITQATGLARGKILDLLLSPALGRLQHLSQRALALELHLHSLRGELVGSTSEERFASFLGRLGTAEGRFKFLGKYPVLARAAVRSLELWRETSSEFLGRLQLDLPELRRSFSFAPGDAVTSLAPGAGDVHCRGRSVVIVSFASGRKLVYKPHSLSADQHFHELLNWCRNRGMAPAPRSLAPVQKDGYGWVEFVPPTPCSSEAERQEFYRKQGAALALFHSLCATDMHHENLVACGPDPVPVDLETLFHAEVCEDAFQNASEAVEAKVRASVLAVGLLPVPSLGGSNEAYDVSGLGARSGQTTPYKVISYEKFGTDEFRIAHVHGEVQSTHNRPGASSDEVLTKEILQGFESAWRFLAAYKEQLLSEKGPLASFALDDTRFVVRPTLLYHILAMDAAHPDFLRDDLDRERHWDSLWNGLEDRPLFDPILRSELRQVADGDVPFFSIHPSETALFGADGSRIENVLKEEGLTRSRNRIAAMNEQSLAEQTWFLRASLGYVEGFRRNLSCEATRSPLEAAAAVGRELLRDLRHEGEMASCLAVSCVTGEHGNSRPAYAVASAGVGLYEGLSGVALFLAYLGRETNEPSFRKGAEALLRNVQTLVRDRPNSYLSGYSGLGSLVYAYTHFAKLWNQPDLLGEAEKLLEGMADLISLDGELDIMAGSAGCLLSVLPLAAARPNGQALPIAIACGERLVSPGADGIPRWRTLKFERGFSHGRSGVAYALSALAAACGKGHFQQAALEVAAAERKSIAGGQWTDRHVHQGEHQVSWCHGASGVALARLGMLRAGRDPEILEDARSALRECRHNFWMPSQCLCHGTLGNLEALLLARDVPSLGEGLEAELNSGMARVLDELREYGCRSALPSQTLSNGLFTGLASIGYGLLRNARASRVPSVLLLEPPL